MGAALVIQIFVYSFKELSNIHFLSFKRKRDKQIGLGGPSDTRPKSYPHTLMTYSKHLLVWNVNTPKKYLHKRYIHFFKTGESWWKEYASKGKWIIATWQAVEQLVIVQNFMSCWIISCLAPGWGVGPYQTQKYKEQFTNFCVYVTRAAKCFLYSDKIFKIGLDPKKINIIATICWIKPTICETFSGLSSYKMCTSDVPLCIYPKQPRC